MTTSTRTTFVLLLELFVLLIGKDTLQLLVILLALFHLLFHLGLLFVGQLRALRALLLVLLGSTGLPIWTRTTMSATHTRTTKHIFIFCIESQHLSLLVVRQFQILCHTICYLLRSNLLGSLTFFLVTILCHYCCH